MNNTILQSNYDAIKSLPIVKQLIHQNKKLNKENKSLRNLICSLPEFRPKSRSNNCCCNTHIKPRCRKTKDDIVIKTEPIPPVAVTIDDKDNADDKYNTQSENNIMYKITEMLNNFDINEIGSTIEQSINLVSTDDETYEDEDSDEDEVEETDEDEVEETDEDEVEETDEGEVEETDEGEVEETDEVEVEETDEVEVEDSDEVEVEDSDEDEVEETDEDEVEETDEGEVEETDEGEVEETDEGEVEETDEGEVEETDEDKMEIESIDETEVEETEDEVFEYAINGVSYYITHEINGIIYKIDDDEDVGDQIGVIINGVPSFTTK